MRSGASAYRGYLPSHELPAWCSTNGGGLDVPNVLYKLALPAESAGLHPYVEVSMMKFLWGMLLFLLMIFFSFYQMFTTWEVAGCLMSASCIGMTVSIVRKKFSLAKAFLASHLMVVMFFVSPASTTYSFVISYAIYTWALYTLFEPMPKRDNLNRSS